MKKIIIGVVAAMSVIVANAAAANWDNSNGDLYEYGGTGNVATGYLAYFINAADLAQGDAVTAAAAGNLAAITSVGYESTVGLSDGGWLEDSGVGDFTNGADLSAYLVIFNAGTTDTATYAYISSVETEFVPGSGMDVNFAFDLSSSATAGNWTAVPEPTSGLLMLLGMAGLALRRRRA